ncbi:MAG: nucleotide sugar dehydrogenase [Pseudomonadota bacterium]|nr:nucleotide sugar dehydrogenase [Pseudomonadota bacterium]
MKIGVIGAGRLGICFALLCEQAGYDVLVSDVREDYVKNLRNKFISTNEPEVSKLLSTSPRLSATNSNSKVIRDCDIIYTLVATPSKRDGSYDVSAVWDVVEDIKKVKKVQGKAFVVGCTTNPGDCEQFQDALKDSKVDVFYNPEFIAQGTIIKDLRTADMVLIGGKRNETYDQLCEIYNRIQETPPKISIMSTTAAELVKLAVNCFLTTKISYANMVGQVMALSGMEDEIPVVLGAIGDDSRVGRKYLNFGFGFGGPCLPRDNRAFAAYAKQLGLDYNLGQTTDNFNDEHASFLKEYFVYRNIDNLPFYFDYVSYKKGTDIITESQQYRLCVDLLDDGYEVYINDNDAIMDMISNDLSEKYPDTVKFGEPDDDVYPIKF